jgi:DNA-binding MarR family transcriptional regulator
VKRRDRDTSSLRRPRVSPLGAHLGYWLRCVSNHVSQALSRELEELGITAAEWVVLRELYEGDRRPIALAANLGLSRSAISKLADRLAAKQMVAQRVSGGDLRGQMLALTDLGRSIVPTLAYIADEIDAKIFGDLDRRTREVIVSALREIIRQRGILGAAGWRI